MLRNLDHKISGVMTSVFIILLFIACFVLCVSKLVRFWNAMVCDIVFTIVACILDTQGIYDRLLLYFIKMSRYRDIRHLNDIRTLLSGYLCLKNPYIAYHYVLAIVLVQGPILLNQHVYHIHYAVAKQ